jgi:hypothetical protein
MSKPPASLSHCELHTIPHYYVTGNAWLRHHRLDIGLLRDVLTRKGLPDELTQWLLGNADETLREFVQRHQDHLVLRFDRELIHVPDFAITEIAAVVGLSVPQATQYVEIASAAENAKQAMVLALAACNNDKVVTAAKLGISLKTLYNWLERFGLKEQYRTRTRRRRAKAATTGNVDGDEQQRSATQAHSGQGAETADNGSEVS